MTRTGDVSTKARRARKRVAHPGFRSSSESVRPSETRGTKTARATRPPAWVPTGRNSNAEAGWSGWPAAPGRHGTASERRRDASDTAGETSGRSVRRREGDGRPIGRAGDHGLPPSRPALESGAARRGMAPGEYRDRRRTAPRRPQRSGRRAEAVTPGSDREHDNRPRSRASQYARTIPKAGFPERRASSPEPRTQGSRAGRSTAVGVIL
jgi:hypothetical protein